MTTPAMKKQLLPILLAAPIGLLAQNPPLNARFEVEPGCGGMGRIFVQVECTEDPFDVMEVWLTRHELRLSRVFIGAYVLFSALVLFAMLREPLPAWLVP